MPAQSNTQKLSTKIFVPAFSFEGKDNLNVCPFPSLLKIFTEADCVKEVFICGGFLRDYFLGRPVSKDIDIFINCSKDDISKLVCYLQQFGRVDYGQYGSPRFYPTGFDVYVDIVPFYNFIVPERPVTDIVSLLSNFDITANAIGYDVRNQILYNPVGGIEDIRNGILRAVRLDFPEKRVSAEIHLSAVSVFWFRLLHYQHKLNFRFSKETEDWIIDNKWRYQDLKAFKHYFFNPCISESIKLFLR